MTQNNETDVCNYRLEKQVHGNYDKQLDLVHVIIRCDSLKEAHGLIKQTALRQKLLKDGYKPEINSRFMNKNEMREFVQNNKNVEIIV